MRLFTKVKEIRSKSGELHFERFAILETDSFGVYIHRIHKGDKDPHLHSHPWNFWTMVLKGRYSEEYLGKDLFLDNQKFVRVKNFLSIASGDRNYFHKILRVYETTYTVFVTYGKPQKWYYKVRGENIESNKYRQLKREGKLPHEPANGIGMEVVR